MAQKSALKLRDHGGPDLDSLIDLARQKSKAGRRALFATVRDLFLDAGETLNDRERVLMGEILRKLVADVERSVRKELAERMAQRADAPRDLVVALANDEIEVAHPILVDCKILEDIDLIEVIQHRTQAHQLAIARRRDISEDVSQALVDTGDTDVITTLLRNGDAAISRSLMEYLVAESKRVDTFQNPLLHREDLPADLARKMYWWVSAALRQHIVQTYNLDPTEIDDMVEGAVQNVMEKDEAEAKARGIKGDEATAFARKMSERGELTEEFLIETLRGGEIHLFEACFAQAVKLAPTLTRRLLYEPGGEGLAVACRAAGFERATYATIFQLTRDASGKGGGFDPRDLARVTEFFDRVERGQANAVANRWRRDADYQDALRQIEEA